MTKPAKSKPTRSWVVSPEENASHPRFDRPATVTDSGLPPHLDMTMSAREHIGRIANHYGITYQNDGIAHLARMIEDIFGNGVEPDETSKLVIAIGRAGVMDGKDLTRLHGRYLQERNTNQVEEEGFDDETF
jgi:hypothetical protein